MKKPAPIRSDCRGDAGCVGLLVGLALFCLLLVGLERLTQVHDPGSLLILGVLTVAAVLGGVKLLMVWRDRADARAWAERAARWHASQAAKPGPGQTEPSAAPSEAKPNPPVPRRRTAEDLKRFDE